MDKLVLEQDEVQGFVLGQEQEKILNPLGENIEVVGSSDYLDNFDFTNDQEFDIETNYEYVQHLTEKNVDENIAKQQEAENIIKELSPKFLNEDFVNKFKDEELNLYALLKKYSSELETTKNMSRKDKDKIFAIANYLFNNYQKKLNLLNYSFSLTRKEFKFLYSLFNKIEYDQNEIFQMDELKKSYLDLHKDLDKKIPKEMEEIPTFINVNMLIILYHLISKTKVKGISDEFYNYRDILMKIADRIKLFNAYNVVVERLSKEFAHWVSTLTALDDDLLKPADNQN